tara:strand:+ start:640 stop:795 length:156 start_codon:yes stop_codon:yes gene_type:complete
MPELNTLFLQKIIQDLKQTTEKTTTKTTAKTKTTGLLSPRKIKRNISKKFY